MPFTSMPETIYHAVRSEYLTSSTLRQLRRQFLPYPAAWRQYMDAAKFHAPLLPEGERAGYSGMGA